MTQPRPQPEFPALTCEVCRLGSNWVEAFTEVRDGTARKRCCPRCALDIRNKHQRASLVVIVCCIALLPFMLPIALKEGMGPELIVASYLTFTVAQHVLVYFHEVGHAIAARIVRAPAYAITIGFEPWIVDRVWWRIRWRIGRIPGGGLTYHLPCIGRNARRREILLLVGGGLANLVIAMMAFGAFAMLNVRPGNELVAFLLIAVGAASAIQMLTAFWPREYAMQSGLVRSDGGRILDLLRGLRAEPRSLRAGTQFLRGLFLFQDREFSSSARRIERAQALMDDPKVVTSLFPLRAAALSESDQAAQAIALLRPLLSGTIEDQGARAGILDNLAWAYMLTDEPDLIEQGLPLVRQACDIAPWEASFLITHACLLAVSATQSNGRSQDARKFLDAIGKRRLEGQNAAYAAFARALIAASEGDIATARKMQQLARDLQATAAPLRLLERRIASI